MPQEKLYAKIGELSLENDFIKKIKVEPKFETTIPILFSILWIYLSVVFLTKGLSYFVNRLLIGIY